MRVPGATRKSLLESLAVVFRPVPAACLVALAAVLAHGLCLRSTFYLDDFVQIVDCDSVDHGLWLTHRLRALTYLTYELTWWLGGISAPAFHLGNLLVHVAASLALVGFARDFLTAAARLPEERAGRISLGAGLLFAVHPLCSEITNYARARDIALVSLCALLAGRGVLRWRRDGHWSWLLAAGAAALAATFCKEVGCIVAGGTMALAWFATRPVGAEGRDTRGRWTWTRGQLAAAVLAAAAGGGVAAWSAGSFRSMAVTVGRSWTDPRMGWHTLTQARVFWRYAARVFLPVRLCSDHQIAWTVSVGDAVAWASLAALVALGLAVGTVLVRAGPLSAGRAAAALGAMALLDVLHRLANVTAELMVEYRMYPALMPLCVLLAWGWNRLARRPGPGPRRTVMAWTGIAVLVGCALLSARRTLDWRSAETLAADITAQYPLQARARQEVQEADLRAHRWQAALDGQKGIREALDGMDAFNHTHVLRRYDPPLAVLTRLGSEGNYAEALARLGRLREARAHLAWLRGAMESNHAQEPMYWAEFYYSSAMVHEAAGEKDEALMDLRDSGDLIPGFEYPRRAARRIAAGSNAR